MLYKKYNKKGTDEISPAPSLSNTYYIIGEIYINKKKYRLLRWSLFQSSYQEVIKLLHSRNQCSFIW